MVRHLTCNHGCNRDGGDLIRHVLAVKLNSKNTMKEEHAQPQKGLFAVPD
jgi:hypothetical protein